MVRYGMCEFVYMKLHGLILLFACKGFLAIGDLFDFRQLLCKGFLPQKRGGGVGLE